MKEHGVASQEYWDSLYECMRKCLKYDRDDILYRDLYEKFIPRGGTCFEIGCYPGNNLLFFAKEFGFSVSGIDITPLVHSQMPAYLKANGVCPEELICQDYFTYRNTKTYDLVCSFGFIEHFSNFQEVIAKHIEMVKPGGILVISCPNLAGLQYGLHMLIDRRWLSQHVISSMNLRTWRRVLKEKHMKLIYHNYYRTAGFVGGPEKPRSWVQRWARRRIAKLLNNVNALISFPNPLLSPWMVSISQRSK